MLCPCYPFSASPRNRRTAFAIERFLHIPFRTGVEECQFITNRQGPVIGDPNLELDHVKNQAWTAGVVAENEVRVKLNATTVSAALHCSP